MAACSALPLEQRTLHVPASVIAGTDMLGGRRAGQSPALVGTWNHDGGPDGPPSLLFSCRCNDLLQRMPHPFSLRPVLVDAHPDRQAGSQLLHFRAARGLCKAWGTSMTVPRLAL